jgi:hypothetical protein
MRPRVVTEAYLERDSGSQVPVAHTYNPSYSGVRDQEDGWFKVSPGK